MKIVSRDTRYLTGHQITIRDCSVDETGLGTYVVLSISDVSRSTPRAENVCHMALDKSKLLTASTATRLTTQVKNATTSLEIEV